MPPPSTPTWRPWLPPALATALPPGLVVVLTFMRPDLMRPMLEHVYGYTWAGVVSALTLLGGALVSVSAFGPNESRGLRLSTTLLGFLGCTLPALVLILFGPIVFAFLYGAVGG